MRKHTARNKAIKRDKASEDCLWTKIWERYITEEIINNETNFIKFLQENYYPPKSRNYDI